MTTPALTETPRYTYTDGQPRVSYHGIQVAMSVLAGVEVNYLPIYNLGNLGGPERFTHYPLLAFVEALVVQAEVAMEEAAALQLNNPFAAWEQAKLDVRRLLGEEKLEHPSIQRYLDDIEEFFGLVHQLKYLQKDSPERVARAVELAPSDYRFLHAILCCRLGKEYDEELFALMRPLEVLRDFYWYLNNYETDVKHGHYNIFIVYARLYGEKAAAHILAEKRRYEAQLAAGLLRCSAGVRRLLQSQVAHYEQAVDVPTFGAQLASKLQAGW